MLTTGDVSHKRTADATEAAFLFNQDHTMQESPRDGAPKALIGTTKERIRFQGPIKIRRSAPVSLTDELGRVRPDRSTPCRTAHTGAPS